MTTKERPILFSGSMVRAILDGRKTQTRRVVKPQPAGAWRVVHNDDGWAQKNAGDPPTYIPVACPYGKPGDRLWVRETWNCIDTGRLTQRQDWVRYRATDGDELRWRPSIFMPRWASRITLEVVSVRVERVQDITPEDVKAEGVRFPVRTAARLCFSQLWNEINSKRGYGWEANPWVWVVEFRRLDANV